MQRQRRGELEKRRLQRKPRGVLHARGELRDAVFRNQVAVDADAFAKIHQMRRGVEPDTVTGRLQHGGRHRGGRPLTVRAADVERGIPVVRPAQPGQHRLDRLEAELDAAPLKPVEKLDGRGI